MAKLNFRELERGRAHSRGTPALSVSRRGSGLSSESSGLDFDEFAEPGEYVPDAKFESGLEENDSFAEEYDSFADDDPSLGLASWADTAAHPELEPFIAKLKAGAYPLSRQLKPNEPQKLNDRHLTAIFLRASGLKQSRVAQITGYTDSALSVILNHPYAQALLTRLAAHMASSVIDMEARVKAAAPEALDTVLEVMRDTNERGSVRSKNAFELLKLAGVGAKQESKVVHEFQVPKEQASLLTEAIRESRNIVDAEYVEIVQGDGSDVSASDSPAGEVGRLPSPAPSPADEG